MLINLDWNAKIKGTDDIFPASVPGNVQSDYAKAHNFGDLQYADNFKKFKPLEDVAWVYSSRFEVEKQAEEKIFFVSLGIDYEYKIYLNSEQLLHKTGMYSKTELDITDKIQDGENLIEVEIFPTEKSPLAKFDDRDRANQSFKPAVCYGWDWHPRLIPSGIWQETYIETRKNGYINYIEPTYKLSEDLCSAEVEFIVECNETPEITLYSPSGEIVYCGRNEKFKLENIELWWCNGQGKPSLYRYVAKTESDEKSGRIGFRKIRLVMNEGEWNKPSEFPKSRSNPPITIELNNRRIFAKGTNWVNPEIFVGEITKERYETQIRYAKEANMNIFRVHGGTIVNKNCFFDLCDEMGIMVWQEFTLACNNYVASERYMSVLEKEASYVIKNIRKHPCHVLWCGGNELFNAWSGMTEQSHALRLLNKLCFEYDYDKPFISTSPLSGMAHGHYFFYDKSTDKDVFQMMNGSENTAYTEFGVPSLAPAETLKRIIPEDEMFPIRPGTAWESHCGLNVWGEQAWVCRNILEHYFGKLNSLDEFIKYSNVLECEGYKAIFGEARRQWPTCSMALNWDYNEPWMNAAGNNLLAYPSVRKPAYYAVANELRNVMFSARIYRFDYHSNDVFSACIFYHNDTAESVSDVVTAQIEIDGKREKLLTWEASCKPLGNKMGPVCNFVLPSVSGNTLFKLVLKADSGTDSEYTLLLYGDSVKNDGRFLNQ